MRIYDRSVLTYLNRGMYDLHEAAHLIGASPSRIKGWISPTASRPALVNVESQGPLSFHELVSLWVVRELRDRGVKPDRIARAVVERSKEWGVGHPLAHRSFLEQLRTDGAAIFAMDADDQWMDVSLGRQGVFQETIAPSLESLDFDDDQMASVWRPAEHIVLNPRVQAGASCVDGTRLATAFVHELLEAGEDPEDLADDYDLEVGEVLAAQHFETSLRSAA